MLTHWLLLVDAGEDPDIVYADQIPMLSFKQAREKIFAKDMTTSKLSELMGGKDKYKIVNWKYVARTTGTDILPNTLLSSTYYTVIRVERLTPKLPTGEARTLEFRQHEGTVSPVAVEHWTAFVVGLVRLAEHNSRVHGSAPDYDGAGYRHREVSEGLRVWDLMETMELDESEVEYWRGVVARRA